MTNLHNRSYSTYINRLLFYLILFILFVIPEKTFININLFGFANLYFLHAASIVLPPVYFLSSSKHLYAPAYLRNIIILFMAYFTISSIIKGSFVSGSLLHPMHDYRLAAVFFAAMFIILSGTYINTNTWFKIFIIAIFISYIISLLLFLFDINIPFQNKWHEDDSGYSAFRGGRLINGNKDFSVFGLYFLFTKHKLKDLISRKNIIFITIVSITSIIIAVLNFDRTLLVLLIIELFILILFYRSISWKGIISAIAIIIFIIVPLVTHLYKNDDAVSKQIDNRILSIVGSYQKSDAVADAMTKTGREYMILSSIDTFFRHPIWGTNQNEPLFYRVNDGSSSWVTDITFVNILARHGIIGFIIFSIIFIILFREIRKRHIRMLGVKKYICSLLMFIIPMFFIYSLNHDAIYRGTVIIIVALFFNSTNHIQCKSDRPPSMDYFNPSLRYQDQSIMDTCHKIGE